MRSSLATLHGLFRPGLGAGVRILGGIIVVAVLVGRASPRPAVTFWRDEPKGRNGRVSELCIPIFHDPVG